MALMDMFLKVLPIIISVGVVDNQVHRWQVASFQVFGFKGKSQECLESWFLFCFCLTCEV